MTSMEDYLKVITPHLHSDLVTPKALSHLQTLAQILPSFSYAGFECRLIDSSDTVDFLFSLPRRVLNIPALFLTHFAWQRLHTFCNEWIEPSSFLYNGVNNVSLEFDIEGPISQVPVPSLFTEINRKMDRVDTLRQMSLIMKRFKHPFSQKMESNLQLCLHALPEGGRIIYLGLMFSRPTQGIRIVVEGLKAQQILPYLVEIGCLDSANKRFENIIPTVSNLVDSIGFIGFDVSETIHPHIGLECFFEKQPLDEPRWESFFDYLIAQGLCSPAKRDALLAWPGVFQKDSAPDLWPISQWSDAFFSNQASSIFFRKLNHIKIVYHPEKPLTAKGYISFGHLWIDDSTLFDKSQ
jgi:hypothetical protein